MRLWASHGLRFSTSLGSLHFSGRFRAAGRKRSPARGAAPVDFGGETLGERITRIRKERGFTQVELASRIGIIQTIISAIESDERKLSAEMAV